MGKTTLQQVGERITEGRIRKAISRKTLAEQAEVPLTSVYRLEKGERGVDLEDALKICKELEFSVGYLLTGGCGLKEFCRIQRQILNMPDLYDENLLRVATAFWATVPKSRK